MQISFRRFVFYFEEPKARLKFNKELDVIAGLILRSEVIIKRGCGIIQDNKAGISTDRGAYHIDS